MSRLQADARAADTGDERIEDDGKRIVVTVVNGVVGARGRREAGRARLARDIDLSGASEGNCVGIVFLLAAAWTRRSDRSSRRGYENRLRRSLR